MSKMFKDVCRKQLLGPKNQGKDAWVGKGLHWEWDATLEAKNKPMKTKFANYNVWKNFGNQTSHLVMLWQVEDINIVAKSS